MAFGAFPHSEQTTVVPIFHEISDKSLLPAICIKMLVVVFDIVCEYLVICWRRLLGFLVGRERDRCTIAWGVVEVRDLQRWCG